MAGRDSWRPTATLLRRVLDGLGDGVLAFDLEGRCLLCNAAARRVLGNGIAGLAVDEWASALGCRLPDMLTQCPSLEMPLARALRGEVVRDLELFIPRPGVSEGLWLSVDGGPLVGQGQVVEGAMVVLRDVTAARSRAHQVALLSSVVEATADAVVVTDPHGRIEYVNPAFEATTGYSRADAVGRTPSLLKSGAHPSTFYAGLWRTLAEGRVFRGTFVNRKKNGELFVAEQTISPVRKPGGGVVRLVSVGKDVTQLRRAAQREESLLLARSVQQRLFPPSQPVVPGFDIYGATFVADVTGGDYYDFIPRPGDCLEVLVADVSGHGVDSALLMAETRAVLRATAQTTAAPSETLAVVNRVLHGDTEAHRFATLLLVRLHLPSGQLAYASAGHTPGYLLDRGGAVKGELPATGLPLGMFADSGYETCSSLRMEPGDTLVLLTDGVTDCGAPEEEQFGVTRALAEVRGALAAPASEIVAGLYRAVRAVEKGGPQRDDVTTVVVKRLPRPPALPERARP